MERPTFKGAAIPALYYEADPAGDDATLLAIIGRWLDTQGPVAAIDLAAFIAAETTGDGRPGDTISPPPERFDIEPGLTGSAEVDVTIRLRLYVDEEAPAAGENGAEVLAQAAAHEALRSFGELDGPEGWKAYRARYDGGPLAADFNELVAGWLGDAMPHGGYEIVEVATAWSEIAE